MSCTSLITTQVTSDDYMSDHKDSVSYQAINDKFIPALRQTSFISLIINDYETRFNTFITVLCQRFSSKSVQELIDEAHNTPNDTGILYLVFRPSANPPSADSYNYTLLTPDELDERDPIRWAYTDTGIYPYITKVISAFDDIYTIETSVFKCITYMNECILRSLDFIHRYTDVLTNDEFMHVLTVYKQFITHLISNSHNYALELHLGYQLRIDGLRVIVINENGIENEIDVFIP